ncbi:MAG: MBL fold metallo-hydrolase [Bacillota bacterium]|nr:MBL fold metallo-hydrolase [Bacillota bacterium]
MKKSLHFGPVILCILVLPVLLFTGCGSSAKKTAAAASKEVSKSASTKVESTAAKDSTNKTKVDINKNDTGKTVIRTISTDPTYRNNSYAIISKSGTEIIVDPTSAVDGLKPDVITSTHNHPDHNDPVLDSKTNCKKSYYTVESFDVKDAHIFSIASSHMGNDIDKQNPTNVIYVFEVDGLRIAHMGDIGQDSLTPEQLKAIGKIDIAFMQFANSYSDYSFANGKGFKVIEQLKPQIIIPTHSDPDCTKKIGDILGSYQSVDDVLAISKDDLKDGKRKVVEIYDNLY